MSEDALAENIAQNDLYTDVMAYFMRMMRIT